MKYRINKLRRTGRVRSVDDPFEHLLMKLSGFQRPPKARQAYQQYMVDHWEAKLGQTAKTGFDQGDGGEATQKATQYDINFKADVARKEYKLLSAEEHKMHAYKAKEIAANAREQYERRLKE